MYMPSVFGDDLFDDFFSDYAKRCKTEDHYQNTGLMRTDIRENENSYELTIDLPGVTKENVKAELEEGYLTIAASTSVNKDENNKKGHLIRRERYYGTAKRSFYIGEDVKLEDIKASFNNGTLVINIPKVVEKPEVPKKQYIQIGD